MLPSQLDRQARISLVRQRTRRFRLQTRLNRLSKVTSRSVPMLSFTVGEYARKTDRIIEWKLFCCAVTFDESLDPRADRTFRVLRLVAWFAWRIDDDRETADRSITGDKMKQIFIAIDSPILTMNYRAREPGWNFHLSRLRDAVLGE